MVLGVSSCTCKECDLPMCAVEEDYRTLMVFVKTEGLTSDSFVLNWQIPHLDSDGNPIENFNSKDPDLVNCQQNICNLVFHFSDEQISSTIDKIEIALVKNEQQVADSVIHSLKWDTEKCISYIHDDFAEIRPTYSYAEINCEI